MHHQSSSWFILLLLLIIVAIVMLGVLLFIALNRKGYVSILWKPGSNSTPDTSLAHNSGSIPKSIRNITTYTRQGNMWKQIQHTNFGLNSISQQNLSLGYQRSDFSVSINEQVMEIEDLLPPVSLNPLERSILEQVITGHKVRQADLPSLVNSSKTQISKTRTSLEQRGIIKRIKNGRTLEILYNYESI